MQVGPIKTQGFFKCGKVYVRVMRCGKNFIDWSLLDLEMEVNQEM